jgi:hypothetical protein
MTHGLQKAEFGTEFEMFIQPRLSGLIMAAAICVAPIFVHAGVASAQSAIEMKPLDPGGIDMQDETDTQVDTQNLPPAQDSRIANKVAVFSGIDKITGRIITFDIYINETVQFGALQVTPRVCYTEDETQNPKADTFVEVDEITLDRKIRRIFTGWMFADSPGLNAVDHPVYDVWLKGCRMNSDVPPPSATN